MRQNAVGESGRGGGIRTPDPLLPKQMRYQAALRPDLMIIPHSSVYAPAHEHGRDASPGSHSGRAECSA
jgi:hypothetical protein